MEQGLCHLDAAMGRSTACPGEECPFWKDESCVIAPLRAQFTEDACLVTVLAGVRAQATKRAPDHALREFHPPGLA